MRDLIKVGCVALVLSLSLAAPVAAGPFEDGSAAWVPCVVLWDERTDELRRVEGPEGFQDYRQAVEASRFLASGRGRTRNDQ